MRAHRVIGDRGHAVTIARGQEDIDAWCSRLHELALTEQRQIGISGSRLSDAMLAASRGRPQRSRQEPALVRRPGRVTPPKLSRSEFSS